MESLSGSNLSRFLIAFSGSRSYGFQRQISISCSYFGIFWLISKVSRSFHVEETWWWRKITSPPNEPPFSYVWLQMIITWSVFITLSPFFFHNDLEEGNFMPSFMCKWRKWMEDALRIQTIIGHFIIFCQLQLFITLSIFGYFDWFRFQNVSQEVYFMPSFLVKSKFLEEGHVWM